MSEGVVTCEHCHYQGPLEEFMGEEAFACPVCGMDESGLDLPDGPLT